MPTVTLQPSSDDAAVRGQGLTSNFGADDYLGAGKTQYSNDSYRSFIKFNLSSIPAGAVVSAATLSLYVYDAVGNGRTGFARRVTGSWTEGGITFNNQPATTTTEQASLALKTFVGWWEVSITAIVSGWVSGSYTNYGVVWRTDDETNDSVNKYNFARSREATTTTERPKLTVTYNTPPSAPTPTAPINGAQIVGTVANNFTMTATDPEADNLNGYEIEYRLVAGGSTSTGTQATSTASGGTITRQFAANTFTTPGSWEWRARTRDAGTNTFGAWSSWASFTVTAIERWGVVHI